MGGNPSVMRRREEPQRSREQVETYLAPILEAILQSYPEAKFSLKPSGEKNLWHLGIYTDAGTIQVPGELMAQLNRLWQLHRVTVVTVVYPLTMYEAGAPQSY